MTPDSAREIDLSPRSSPAAPPRSIVSRSIPLPNPVDAVHFASRVEVSYTGKLDGPTAELRPSSIYFYIGLDCSAAIEDEGPCSEAGGNNGAALVVVDSDLTPRRSLLVKGSHPQLGGFEMEAGVASMQDGGELSSNGENDVTVAFMGKTNTPIVDIKQEVEKLHKKHGRASRRAGKDEGAKEGPFVLPNTFDDGSNLVLVQVKE